VPLFIDGIPVYVPYDGTLDLARFTTYDISRIDVSKGYASMMYGANTIGGAINLIGLKPSHSLEVRAMAGMMSGKGFEASLNAGGKFGKFYVQSGFSMLNRDHISLSADFDTSKSELDHKRDNSYYKDIKANVKVGFMPKNTDEYSLNFMISHGTKGNPIYLGTNKNIKIRYWNWPNWDKKSLYFISKTAVGDKSQIKTRFYYDVFENKLSSFDDNTYITQTKAYAFTSMYDDFSLGGHIEFERSGNSSTFRMSAALKNDVHREHNVGEPVRHFADNTLSLAMEDVLLAGRKLWFVPGIGYHIRKSQKAEDYNATAETITELPANTNDALNAQLAVYYRLSASITSSFTVAWKSRFATMKDRYSYRQGTAIPNPDLKSEKALNLEAATKMVITPKLSFQPEFFYSHLSNTIQMVSNVSEDMSQMRNTGSSEFAGLDASLIFNPAENLDFTAVYSFIHRKNLSNPDILFIDVPKSKLLVSASYTIKNRAVLLISGEYDSRRNNASDGTRVSAGFAIANALLTWEFGRMLEAEAGLNNVFDKNYTLQEGYPEMGRNFFLAMHFSLEK
jgi:iron complex outermembrane receptor protein